MSEPIVRRLIAVLALSALLGSPATSLAGPRPAARHSRTRAAAQAPLSWLWNALVSVWEKEGCSADPYGRCVTVSQPTTDAGCLIDPNGRCITITPQKKADAGCSADPYGRCLPGQ
jgi:hypothetical protein